MEKKIYFIWIWWIWISALARYYNSIWYKVFWSDKVDSELLEKLRWENIDIFIWENADNIDETFEKVIFTEAIPLESVELQKAKKLWLKTLSYPEWLAEIVNKEILISIQKAVDSSPELRSKKTLIENFIEGINDMDDVISEWHDFVIARREEDLRLLIETENLRTSETRKYLENAFRDGEIRTTGTDIVNIMQPVSRFGGGQEAKKKALIEKLQAFFEKYFGISGSFFEDDSHSI